MAVGKSGLESPSPVRRGGHQSTERKLDARRSSATEHGTSSVMSGRPKPDGLEMRAGAGGLDPFVRGGDEVKLGQVDVDHSDALRDLRRDGGAMATATTGDLGEAAGASAA